MRRPPLPSLLDAGAVQLGAAMAAGAVSPVEVVDAHIARLEAINGSLNALVDERFDAARREARAAEAALHRRAGGPRSPLFGVPCTIKEFLAVEGLSHTAGLTRRRGRRATADATVVRRLREAGAIILGVTNVPEGGLWMETHNLVYGRTNNPWDLARTAGGSSGGEAALIAAGGSPFGLGSDVGGSIRTPAAFCGVTGHKPSGRLVPGTGHLPAAHGAMAAFMVVGPLARRVEDLHAVLRIIAGPDGEDPIVRPFPPHDPRTVELRDLVVYPVETNGRTRIRGEVRQAVRNAARILQERGATIRPLRAPLLERAFEIWSAMLAEAPAASYSEVLGDGAPIRLLAELGRIPLGRRQHTVPALVVVALERLVGRLGETVATWAAAGRRLQREIEEALGPRGVLLHPPYSRAAPRHRGPLLTPLDFVCTAIFNVLEFPVTQVPLGFDGSGLPLGVQVAAARGQDHLTLAVAEVLEGAGGGWRRAEPPP